MTPSGLHPDVARSVTGAAYLESLRIGDLTRLESEQTSYKGVLGVQLPYFPFGKSWALAGPLALKANKHPNKVLCRFDSCLFR